MSSPGNSPQGVIPTAVTIAILAAAGLFTGVNVWSGYNTFSGTHTVVNHLELPNAQINVSGHIITLPSNTGTALLTNGSFSGTLSNNGHVSTLPSNTGTLLQTNGSGASLTGVSASTLSTNGHTSSPPSTTGTIAQLNQTTPWTSQQTFNTNAGHSVTIPTTGGGNLLPTNGTFTGTLGALATNTLSYLGHILTLPSNTGTIMTQNYTRASNFTTPTNQTGTSSLNIVMLGAYVTITPKDLTRVSVHVSGNAQDSTISDGCRIDVRYSTTNMGVNGAAVTGTVVGNKIITDSTAATAPMTFGRIVDITGLTPNTKYFIDLGFAAITGGTCSLTNVDWYVEEH